MSIKAYPPDSVNATPEDLKDKIKEVLKSGKPVLYPGMCVISESPEKCNKGGGHSLVISGYKKVCDANKANCKELLKIHNSWGKEWQRKNNDGWVEADPIIQNVLKEKNDYSTKIVSASLIWFE